MKTMIKMTLVLLAVMTFQVSGAEAATSTLNLKATSGNGKLYDTGDDKIRVLQLKGTWYEIGQQYGKLAKADMVVMWDALVEPVLKKGWATEDELLGLWGKRVYGASSKRRQQFFDGLAAGMGWPVEKVVLLDQSGLVNVYQGKLHSFSGCSSLLAKGEATKNGHTITGRNMDWSDLFVPFKVYVVVYNPEDGSNSIATVGWAGWTLLLTAMNDKGVYVDLHDGTSMGGAVVSADRPSFMHQVFDFLADGDNASSVSLRFKGTRVDMPTIWSLADSKGDISSIETTLYNSLQRLPEGDFISIVNTHLNPDWGLYARDTISNSFTRYKNLNARASEASGSIDAAKMREIFDLRLFNEDGTFMKNGGVTKPTNQDVDLTNYQVVSDLNTLEMWVKLPPQKVRTDWRYINLKALFE